ncbi:MAG TPA: hypothetical protein VJT73_10440 [Polyangiaceae bacterium]|nr:hypothetical protein [Polyangiaceae bacterium]
MSPRSAAASTFLELSVAELVSKSTLVVVATPRESSSVWEDSEGGRGRRIVTYTRLRVDRVIDGAPQKDAWVRTLGGQVGDIGQHVEGEVSLAPEAPSLLFLRARNDGTHAVVGMSQGHFSIEAKEPGGPYRVLAPRAVGRLLEKQRPDGVDRLPARVALPGRTLDDVAQLVAAVRRSHAP